MSLHNRNNIEVHAMHDSPQRALVDGIHGRADWTGEDLRKLGQIGHGADDSIDVGRMCVRLQAVLDNLWSKFSAIERGGLHEEDLFGREVRQTGQTRLLALALGAHEGAIGVKCVFQAAVVSDVLAQRQVAIDLHVRNGKEVVIDT